MISNETIIITTTTGFPGGSDGQESACKVKNPWVRKIPWRKKWQPTPVFLPGEFHGQRSLVGYSPWSHKESDTTLITTVTIIHMQEREAKEIEGDKLKSTSQVVRTSIVSWPFFQLLEPSLESCGGGLVFKLCPTLCNPIECVAPLSMEFLPATYFLWSLAIQKCLKASGLKCLFSLILILLKWLSGGASMSLCGSPNLAVPLLPPWPSLERLPLAEGL